MFACAISFTVVGARAAMPQSEPAAPVLTPPAVYAEAPKREMRAVWLTTLNGLDWPTTKATSPATRELQKQELRDILDRLKAANINTILLQTRVRATVIYPSDIEPWDNALTGTFGRSPGYDPLAFAIDEAHRRGMELHAWVVTIPCFKSAVLKAMGRSGIVRKHPDLVRRHQDMFYLDPGIPASADYLVAICHEIVSRYDIDGLHFDYIRYPEHASSFNDSKTYKRYGCGKSLSSWRRDNITHIVRRIYDDVKRCKPWVCVSSSPVGKYADLPRHSSHGWNARDAVHQDAEGWLRAGIHDMLFPMLYFDGNHFYPFAADWHEQNAGRHVAAGLGIYLLAPSERNWPLSAIVRQLNFTRRRGLAGQCYFRSRFLTDNVKGFYDLLQRDFYAYPALPPQRTWLHGHKPEPPSDVHIEILSDCEAELRWNAPELPASSARPAEGGLRYNVYASRSWPVDTERAENLVAVALTQPRFPFNRLYAALSGYNLAVTALDRYGNESAPTQLSAFATTDLPPWRLDLTRRPYINK